MWRNLQAGNYTLSFGGAAIGKVDPDGVSPGAETVSVVAGATNTVNYEFDSPGRIENVQFRTRDYGNNLDPMTWDSMVVGHTSMQTPRVFTSTSGRQLTMSTPQTLYPFVTPYAVYAGTCGSNDPGAGLGLGSVVVPVGATVTGPTIQLPSLQVTLWSGSGPASPGSRVQGGDVTAEDEDCNVTRTLTTSTDANGRVPDDGLGRPMIGLPYGEYDICANNAAQDDRRLIGDFDLNAVGSSGTTLDVYLGGTSGGPCP
jgi:hypothetical protein